jgi:hypothetical protein
MFRRTLASGIVRIYGECYVLGRWIVALVLTFVLTDDEAKRIDAAPQNDAESRVERRGTYISRGTVRDIKRERIRAGVRPCAWRRLRSILKTGLLRRAFRRFAADSRPADDSSAVRRSYGRCRSV